MKNKLNLLAAWFSADPQRLRLLAMSAALALAILGGVPKEFLFDGQAVSGSG